MRILLFCCKGFETVEFAPVIDVMRWARNDYHHDIDDFEAKQFCE